MTEVLASTTDNERYCRRRNVRVGQGLTGPRHASCPIGTVGEAGKSHRSRSCQPASGPVRENHHRSHPLPVKRSVSRRRYERERTQAGLQAARARGRKGGRRKRLDPEQRAHAVELYQSRQHTVKQICGLMGISRATLYAYVQEASHGS